MRLEIVLPTSLATTGNATLRVKLDGALYVLRLQWCERQAQWSMDLSDVDGVEIATGIALVPFWSLLELTTDARRPPGQLMVWNTDGSQGAPTLEGLGTDSKLLYYGVAS